MDRTHINDSTTHQKNNLIGTSISCREHLEYKANVARDTGVSRLVGT